MYSKDQIARMGVAHCMKLASKQRMIFREQPTDDYGIDAQIETKIETGDGEDYASGKLIAVQIKSGKGYFKECTPDYVVYRGEMKHYDYWLKHSLPVIIVLYHPDTEECIWEHVNLQNCEKIGKTWKITIPRSNRFDNCRSKLENLVSNQTQYEKRLHTLLLAKPWMEAIKAGKQVVLESEEWINKTSGQGSIKLSIMNKTEEEVVINWEMAFFGIVGYADVFMNLFPWADFEIDHDLYDEIEESEYIETNCPYDSEEGEYLFANTSEFYEALRCHLDELPKIRPYAIEYGEVAKYRLILTLNRIGEIFMELDSFLENGTMYCLSERNLNK